MGRPAPGSPSLYATEPGTPALPSCALAFGRRAAVDLALDDTALRDWVEEFLEPAFAVVERSRPADWRVVVSASAEARGELLAGRPGDAIARPCFAFDQSVLSLPAWEDGDAVVVDDDERSCAFAVRPGRVDLVGDPASRRWRFTLLLVLYELVATRLRRTELELHAAAVETAGRAILMPGPKWSGKTTLSLHLQRSGRCRAIANDRVFADERVGGFAISGVPTVVKIRRETVAGLPELHRGLRWGERPYLESVEEAGRPAPAGEHVDELWLSPAQVADRLGAGRAAEAPVAALVFPEVRTEIDGFAVQPLTEEQVGSRIRANRYGVAAEPRASTIFEDGRARTLGPGSLADRLAGAASGFRIALGRGAYDDPDFASRFLECLDLA